MTRTMIRFKTVIAGLALAVFGGCLVPENFISVVEFRPDASYSYSFAGTAIHAMAQMQVKSGQPLTAKDEQGLKAEAEKMAKERGVSRAIYLGNARYDLKIEDKKKAGESLNLLDFLRVRQNKDGSITISSPEMKEDNKRELESLGIKVSGTLEVKLPKNAEVISHNATSAPKLFGLVGGYKWNIGSVSQQPMMKIRILPKS